jgi:hypothetical protein
MSNYTPDRWVILEINNGKETLKKVFAGWYGGFANGDSWKLNSGNVSEQEFETSWEFNGHSGSKYICYKAAYGTSSYMHSILEDWVAQLPKDMSIKVDLSYTPPREPYESIPQ